MTGRCTSKHRARVSMREQGFSLIELMIVLVILAVFLGIAAPAFVDTIKNNRMLTEAYALRATLASARSEALARRLPVIVCESDDALNCAADTTTWSDGYLAFADINANGAADPNEILVSRQVDAPQMNITFYDEGGAAISRTRFSTRGDALGEAGTFVVCDDRTASDARAWLLLPSGEVRAAVDDSDTEEDPDDIDGIVDDLGGANVTCP